MMKTAYERALERLGLESRSYTKEQKKKLAEIDRECEARAAEMRLIYEPRIRNETDEAKKEEIQQQLARELAAVEDDRERRKDDIRKQDSTA